MRLKSLVYLDLSLQEVARILAERLALNCVDGSSASVSPKAREALIREQCTSKEGAFVLVLDKNGLALHTINLQGNTLSIRADFHGATTTYRRKKGGGKSQMIARAVGIKNGVSPNVLDATAGLGKDAFVLASIGCQVTLLEREPIIHVLLEDAMKRAERFAAHEDSTLQGVLNRMNLVRVDAMNYMREHLAQERPDVVYLDPMFPPRTKSARVKKEMQVFHCLLGTDDAADALLEAALQFARYRVVVKRPRLAPTLSGHAPGHTLEGKRNRYDVYTLRKLPEFTSYG